MADKPSGVMMMKTHSHMENSAGEKKKSKSVIVTSFADHQGRGYLPRGTLLDKRVLHLV